MFFISKFQAIFKDVYDFRCDKSGKSNICNQTEKIKKKKKNRENYFFKLFLENILNLSYIK